MTQRLLDIAGIGKERLHLEWLSSAEAQRFVDIASMVTTSIRRKGKIDNEAVMMELEAAEMTLSCEEVRWLVGKQITITTKGDVYGRSWNEEKYLEKFNNILEREYHKNLICLAIKQGHTSVRDISKKTKLEVLRVSYLLADLEKTSRVEFAGMNNRIPAFAAL